MADILLDTNAFSFFVSGNKRIKGEIERANNVYLPAVVVGELCVGYEGGKRKELNYRILEKVIADEKVKIFKIGLETAKIYGEMIFRLNKDGISIPSNDVWVAACAVETDSVVITYDRHFLQIPGARVWKEIK